MTIYLFIVLVVSFVIMSNMSDKHTLSLEYQIKQSRRCKNLSIQNRVLFSALETVMLQLKQQVPSQQIIENLDKILKENSPL